jgi:hypothetical protein
MRKDMLQLAACALLLPAAAVATQAVNATNTTTLTRACQPPYDTFPFCNTSLSLEERVADVVARIFEVQKSNNMTIPSLLTARHPAGQVPDDNISSLGIPDFDYGMNAM